MSRKVMMNGNYVAWNDATVHITTHALHYGTAVFEGIRAYYNDDRGQSFIVRLMEHVERLYRNIRVLRLTVPLTKQELSLIHISEPTRQAEISYAVFCLKKKKE